MKPPVFDYVAARSLDEAIEALGDEEAKILAGGQSLTPMMNFRLVYPSKLVDINRIPGLGAIKKENRGLSVGALVRHREIEVSPVIRDAFPMLSSAAEHVGHLAIRNRGTFCGSLAHNDPAAEWPMMTLLLDGTVKTASAKGGRSIPIKDFLVTYLTTSLENGEIVKEIQIPAVPAGAGWALEELSRRHGDFALAAVGVLVTAEGGKCKEARISMGGVGPTALRATEAESFLTGKQLTPDVLKQAAAEAAEASDPSNDVHASADYRRHLVSVLTRRALKTAADRAA
jgi:carbon-monoxide dehydrogenase medium subunit